VCRAFDATLTQPIEGSCESEPVGEAQLVALTPIPFSVREGYVFCGQGHGSGLHIHTPKISFLPRPWFGYQWNSKTVIRTRLWIVRRISLGERRVKNVLSVRVQL